jgi:tetratricopeptide (TPR) repeat protein
VKVFDYEEILMEMAINEALNQGVSAQRAGRIEEADAYYTAILNKQPHHPDANHNMGILVLGVGKVQQALKFLETALKSNPDIPQYWISYIDTLIKLNRIEEAKKTYNEARTKGITKDPFLEIKQMLGQTTSIETSIQAPQEPHEYLTTGKVAKKAGIHRDTLLRWLRDKLIPEPKRDRRGWRIFSYSETDAICHFAKGVE